MSIQCIFYLDLYKYNGHGETGPIKTLKLARLRS